MSNCNGCSLIDPEFYPVCLLFEIEQAAKNCPCKDCLIKSNCSEMCSSRGEYYKTFENDPIIGTLKYKYLERYVCTSTRKLIG